MVRLNLRRPRTHAPLTVAQLVLPRPTPSPRTTTCRPAVLLPSCGPTAAPPAPGDARSCKPYLAEAILNADGIPAALEGKLLVSVLAGVTIAQLQSMVPKSCTVVRAMPNTPARVRASVSSMNDTASSCLHGQWVLSHPRSHL